MEKWIKLDRYNISSLGSVIGPLGKCLKPFLHNTGYLSYCHRYGNGIRKTVAIHRIVAKLFIDNPDNKPEVNHINGVKTDNRIENLEWSTRKENAIHSRKIGLQKSKLDRVAVIVIRDTYATGKWNQTQIANYFKIHPSSVSDIVNLKSRING